MGATLLGAVRKRLTAPPATATLFTTRGFETDDAPAREQLEVSAFQLFVLGYEFGSEQKSLRDLAVRLDCVQREYQGFAYEGAVTGLAIRDALSPIGGGGGGRLTEAFLAGPEFDSAPGSKHVFTGYAGIGSALARLPQALWRRALPKPGALAGHPCMYWLIIDGYGWHKGYFEHRKYIDQQYVGDKYPGWEPLTYANRAIDQGLGRAMWFVYGGSAKRLLAGIARFPESRRADLFCGAGLGATYAGGSSAEQLETLLKGAGPYRANLARGAVFASGTRLITGLVTPHNELAAQILCGRSVEEAALLALEAQADLPNDASAETYELFQQRIMDHFR